MLWLGSLHQGKGSILNLKLSDESVYALGVYFSYDEELATKRNFFEKLPKLKKILNIWSSRDIFIYGRVNIVETLAISKLTIKNTIIKNKKEGGLNMLDFTLFDNALKIVWVKRLCAKMKDHGNLFHYPYFPTLVEVFFSCVTMTFNIYPWMKTYQNSIEI